MTIWAEPQTNALVVTAPPKVMRSVMAIVDRLDIRRAQVLVEAILVEMSIDKARDLGINWVVGDRDSEGNLLPAAGFLTPSTGRVSARSSKASWTRTRSRRCPRVS